MSHTGVCPCRQKGVVTNNLHTTDNGKCLSNYWLLTTDYYFHRKGKASADRLASELLFWAETVKVRLDPLPDWEKLVQSAENAFYARCYDQGRFDADFVLSHNAIVAYIRHELSNYHHLLDYLTGKPACAEAYQKIKDRVNEAIERKLRERYASSHFPKSEPVNVIFQTD